MMTLAQLKRDIKNGTIKALQTVEFNGIPYPEEGGKMSGIRKIMTVQSNAFSLKTGDSESWTYYPKAKQVQYTGDFLRIFYTEDNDVKRSHLYKVYR